MPTPATIEWAEGNVRILDQSRLPEEVVYLHCRDYQCVARAITDLKIRGAPAIGIAAAMGVALGAQSISTSDPQNFLEKFQQICDILSATRPTAVNLTWAIGQMNQVLVTHPDEKISVLKEKLVQKALELHQQDIAINQTLGKAGAELIRDGNTILTHCNAGSLATGGFGTALGVIRTSQMQGKKINVLVDETRPVFQGSRLTAWELQQDQIPMTLITDSMAGTFMQKGKVHLCIVGADRIAANGDVANKIGTYSVAVLAHHHGIPFYVAAPISTIDFSLATGEQIPIEERNPEEVTHWLGRHRVAPAGISVANPAFDVTPERYITAIITEKGIFPPRELSRLKEML